MPLQPFYLRSAHTQKQMNTRKRQWDQWLITRAEISPVIHESTVLQHGAKKGMTAKEALADERFATWLLSYDGTISGEARGLLVLLLDLRAERRKKRRLILSRWFFAIWSVRLRNALWWAAEQRSKKQHTYQRPPIEDFIEFGNMMRRVVEQRSEEQYAHRRPSDEDFIVFR